MYKRQSDNHPPSVGNSLPADHAAACSHTNDENPLNDSQISSQHDTSRYESARNFAGEFRMTPTSRTQGSTPTPLGRTNTSVTPSSSNNTTSGAHVQAPVTNADTATAVSSAPRNPIHFVMKQSDLPKGPHIDGSPDRRCWRDAHNF